MKTAAQQRAAALCRHAPAAEARTRFWTELSEAFPTSPHRHDVAAFASFQRRQASLRIARLNDAFGLQLKPSTLCTWLRQWRKSAGSFATA
ncbi:hypothetical protein RAMLITH_22585 [Ramlibacter sp. RBP-2]|uniref:Uncharacterized protein n=1 Tax=Ramlibacter lithotrophicus TaxID=2606681 RepID=A0A7X6DK20_9BURK|nr:hypothetical protein [Ramlibacter lithotrophicus]NKE68612.1 hypothetical protein [Ramlibacter lithotrophicus]